MSIKLVGRENTNEILQDIRGTNFNTLDIWDFTISIPKGGNCHSLKMYHTFLVA